MSCCSRLFSWDALLHADTRTHWLAYSIIQIITAAVSMIIVSRSLEAKTFWCFDWIWTNAQIVGAEETFSFVRTKNPFTRDLVSGAALSDNIVTTDTVQYVI